MSQLSDEEVGRLVRALAKYSQTGELPKLPGNERFVADFMVSQIDRDNKRYLQKCDKQRENVKKRWDTDGVKAADDGKKDTMVYDGIKPAEDGGDDTKDTKEKTHYKKSRDKVQISENNPPPLTRVNQMLADRQRGRWRE